jgi:adenylate cyclase class IV
MYEIEHRAVLTEEQYAALSKELAAKATLVGQDDKEVTYFIFKDKLLKVVHNLTQGTAKLSLKLTALGEGSLFEEIEIPFPKDSYAAMKTLCEKISTPDQVIVGTQKRTNYRYGDVEIALKWSEDWGYHAEFEIMVSSPEEKESADAHIREVAKQLSVKLMTEEEVGEFSAKVRARRKA